MLQVEDVLGLDIAEVQALGRLTMVMNILNIFALKNKEPMLRTKVNHMNSRHCKMNNIKINSKMSVKLTTIALKNGDPGTVGITTMNLMSGMAFPTIREKFVLVTGSSRCATKISKTRIQEGSSFTTPITIRQTLTTCTVKNVNV